MTLSTRPRGTNDILPSNIGVWTELENIIRKVCHTYGYQEIRTPIFEHTDLFHRGIGDTTDIVEKEMYTFVDRGKRSITLRPEGTAPIVRAFLENKLYSGAQPTKLFYYGPMFRYERPQAGRYRQFTQFGLEAIGSADPLLDVETILLPLEVYKACGLSEFEIEINSIGCASCRPAYRQKLQAYVAPHLDSLCNSCKSRYERNPLRLLDCKVKECRDVMADAPLISDFLCPECGDHFEQVKCYLDSLQVDYKMNPRLVRGFDYYTRTVFEVVFPGLGAQNAIGAGGRYDGLVEEMGGEKTPAVGFAVGVERLVIALEQQGIVLGQAAHPDVFIVHFGDETKQRAIHIAYDLRQAGLWVESNYLSRSMRAQMKAANRFGARYVIVIGEDEIVAGKVRVRNMQSGEETLVEQGNIKEFLENGEA